MMQPEACSRSCGVSLESLSSFLSKGLTQEDVSLKEGSWKLRKTNKTLLQMQIIEALMLSTN